MITKVIWIEWREPKTKEEEKRCGDTIFSNESTARIFINTKQNGNAEEEVKTFWHELCHVFLQFHARKPKRSKAVEEDLCRRLENVVWELLR